MQITQLRSYCEQQLKMLSNPKGILPLEMLKHAFPGKMWLFHESLINFSTLYFHSIFPSSIFPCQGRSTSTLKNNFGWVSLTEFVIYQTYYEVSWLLPTPQINKDHLYWGIIVTSLGIVKECHNMTLLTFKLGTNKNGHSVPHLWDLLKIMSFNFLDYNFVTPFPPSSEPLLALFQINGLFFLSHVFIPKYRSMFSGLTRDIRWSLSFL